LHPKAADTREDSPIPEIRSSKPFSCVSSIHIQNAACHEVLCDF
jgi:hypothetical protein